MTPSLGKKFPPDFVKTHCDTKLTKGAVVRVHSELTHPPKIKRFVIIGTKEECGTVGILFFNKEISPHKLANNRLRNLQLALPSKDRDYLDDDSYLDCSWIYEKDLEDLRNQCVQDPSILLGAMSSEDFSLAENLTKGATTISPKFKKRYGLI